MQEQKQSALLIVKSNLNYSCVDAYGNVTLLSLDNWVAVRFPCALVIEQNPNLGCVIQELIMNLNGEGDVSKTLLEVFYRELAETDRKKIPYSRIEVGKEIGQGSFSNVYEAYAVLCLPFFL